MILFIFLQQFLPECSTWNNFVETWMKTLRTVGRGQTGSVYPSPRPFSAVIRRFFQSLPGQTGHKRRLGIPAGIFLIPSIFMRRENLDFLFFEISLVFDFGHNPADLLRGKGFGHGPYSIIFS